MVIFQSIQFLRKFDFPNDEEQLEGEPILSKLVPDDGVLLKHLTLNFKYTKAFFLSIPKVILLYCYEEGKWNIKEILMHMIDMERIYSYRMLCIARNEKSSLPFFNDLSYNANSGANNRDVSGLLEEFEIVRNSTIMLLNSLSEEALLRVGIVGNKSVSVRALAYHIAGHELHHLAIVKERYLSN